MQDAKQHAQSLFETARPGENGPALAMVANVVLELRLADLGSDSAQGLGVIARAGGRGSRAGSAKRLALCDRLVLNRSSNSECRTPNLKAWLRELAARHGSGKHSTAGKCNCLFVHYTAALLRRKPIPVCRQSKLPLWQQVPRRGSSFHGGVPQLRNNKQASGASLHLHLELKRLQALHADRNIEPVRYSGTRIPENMMLQ